MRRLCVTKRRLARQQFIQQYAQRVDIAAGVHIAGPEIGLFRTHVIQRAHHRAQVGQHGGRVLARRGSHCLGDSKVDHLRDRLAIPFPHQYV